MNPKLQDAVAIFKELGWQQATPENVLQLPLGTAEQKQTALAGLKSGDWGGFVRTSNNTYGYRSEVDVDEGTLALFAVRVGVNARRAANILHKANRAMLVEVVAARGVKYTADFIGFACNSRRRMWEHSASVFGNAAVRLVDKLDMDIPQNIEYMKDWAVYAGAAMSLVVQTRYDDKELPGMEMIERRFAEHIAIAVAVNTPATGPLGEVLPAGVQRGLLPREKAVALVFSALDTAVRPGDRKVWLDVLEVLGVSNEELAARTQALIPLLTTGDATAVGRLAPVLIAQADDSLLAEVLVASLTATTKKARQAVLKAALARSRPQDTEELVPWLSLLAGDSDKTIATMAKRLMAQWGMEHEVLPEEPAQTQHLWQATPPVWQLPAFELGDTSPEALTELAAVMINRAAMVYDVIADQFLAVANAVAYRNPEDARISLRGLRSAGTMLQRVICWVKQEAPRWGADDLNPEKPRIYPPLDARDYVVCLHLDTLPCLLSTPSMVDLSIRVPDLVKRLALYKETGTGALEADLFLALTRLDVATSTPEVIGALGKLDVPVLLQSGEAMPITAGQAVLAYLDDPIQEAPITLSRYGHLGKEEIVTPDSLRGFPPRLKRHYLYELFSIFPLWGDPALSTVRWSDEVYHEKGLVLRQAARRATPLPPGAAINMLAAQRSHTPDAAEDSMLAVSEAWQRGLLRPGVPDVAKLDWSAKPPAHVATLAAALGDIAQDGMLAVVWPVLDGVIEASLKAPRLVAGTAEIAELIATLLPEVQAAVQAKIAAPDALYLPGIRALAQRGATSRAISAARQIVALLPPAPAAAVQPAVAPVLEKPFDEVWPAQKEAAPLIEDGVGITADIAAKIPNKPFLFTLTLPGITDRVFQVLTTGWHYDMEKEGQRQAYAVAPGTTTFMRSKETQVWLHWDAEQNALVVCNERNWAKGGDKALQGPASPLSISLLTVMIGWLAQDGDAKYFAPRMLQKFVENGVVGTEVTRRATQTLLQSPAISPAKLVRVLEKDATLLPALWPMLVECIRHAGAAVAAGEAPPVWVNRVLDICLRYTPYLAEAAKRGLIPPEDTRWPGLADIAGAKAKSAAVTKAKKFLVALV